MKMYLWPSIALLALLASAWLFRWEGIPHQPSGGNQIYALDRWTGQFYVIYAGSDGVFKVGPAVKRED